jgi:hypothetical protein
MMKYCKEITVPQASFFNFSYHPKWNCGEYIAKLTKNVLEKLVTLPEKDNHLALSKIQRKGAEIHEPQNVTQRRVFGIVRLLHTIHSHFQQLIFYFAVSLKHASLYNE